MDGDCLRLNGVLYERIIRSDIFILIFFSIVVQINPNLETLITGGTNIFGCHTQSDLAAHHL